jgi:hypothetical protein
MVPLCRGNCVHLTLELELRGGQGAALAAVGRPAAPSAPLNRYAAAARTRMGRSGH